MKFQLFLCIAYLTGLAHGARPLRDNPYEFGRLVPEEIAVEYEAMFRQLEILSESMSYSMSMSYSYSTESPELGATTAAPTEAPVATTAAPTVPQDDSSNEDTTVTPVTSETTEDLACIEGHTDDSPFTDVGVVFEVELSDSSDFLDDLEQLVDEAMTAELNLCGTQGTLRNLIHVVQGKRVLEGAAISGIESQVTMAPDNELCSSENVGTTCHVVDGQIRVYSQEGVSPDQQQQEALAAVNELETLLEDDLPSKDIVAVRVTETFATEDSSVGGGSPSSSTGTGSQLSAAKTATASVLSVLAASAVVVVVARKVSKKKADGSDDESSYDCDESDLAHTADPTLASDSYA